WTTYKIAPKWKIGGGGDFVGERKGFSIGTAVPYTEPVVRQVPGYARLDAMAEWEMLKATTLKLNLFNILDKQYYDDMYPNGAHAVPGSRRRPSLSLSYKF